MPRVDRPYVCDESRPESLLIPPGTQRVWFENERRSQVDVVALRCTLMDDSGRYGIDEIDVGWSSTMTSPWVARLFPNLRSVKLYGHRLEDLAGLEDLAKLDDVMIDTQRSSRRSLKLLPELRLKTLSLRIAKAQDVEYLADCQPLEALALTSWRLPDLRPIGALEMSHLRLSVGSARSLAGLNCSRLSEAWLMQCTKLRDVAGIRVGYLVIASCNCLDVGSIASVQGLRNLWIMDHKEMSSLDFVGKCRSLEILTIDNSRITCDRFETLIEHPTLRRVLLVRGVPDRAIERVASANQRLAITNGRIYFFRGQRVSQDDWFLLTREELAPGDRAIPG